MSVCPSAKIAPIVIEPALESIDTAPEPSISMVVAPLRVVAPVPPRLKVALPSVSVRALVDVRVIAAAASTVTFAPAFRSRLPAVAVIAIASAAVPEVLVRDIFSLPAVP